MNSSDAEAIVLVIVLIAVVAALFVPLTLFFGYAFCRKGKREQTRAAIVRDQQQLIGSNRWFPVRYASELRFKSFFKIFPWEGAGVIIVMPGRALFLGHNFSGPVQLQFAPANSPVNWLGKAPFPNGAVSWFYFETPAWKHYFSSETGVLIFGSNRSTKAIYEDVRSGFLATSAP